MNALMVISKRRETILAKRGQRKGVEKPFLLLPNELVYKILVRCIGAAIHTIACTKGPCTWEMNIFVTFHCVSHTFRAISREVACRAFDLFQPPAASFLPITRDTLVSLRDMAMRLRGSNDLSSPFVRPSSTPTEPSFSPSPFFVSYVLYLNSIALRETANTSTAPAFQSIHDSIIAALTQSLALCERVSSPRVAENLRAGILEELELSQCGTALVQGFNDLAAHAESMRILQPCVEKDGTGPMAAIRSLIHTSLAKVEAAIDAYPLIMENGTSFARLKLFQLPGVLIGLRRVCALQFTEDEYDLQTRIEALRRLWVNQCPFMKSKVPFC